MLKSYLSNFCLKTLALSSFRSLKALGSLLLLLFVGTEAQGILLVSNFGQPTKTDNNGNAEYHSYTESHLLVPGFFTPNTLLHTLTAIKVIIAADGKAPTTINLREVSRNNPIITTFSLQGTYTGSGTNTYIPNKETVLKKNTLYLFALGHSKGGWGHVVQTSSNDEDATSQQGWRTADDLYSERLSKYATPAVKIEVHGNYYFAPVSTLAAGGVLISNIDGGRHSGFNSGRQEFTTGSWPNGYKIRSIEVYGQQSGTLTSEGLYQGNTKVADFTATGTPTTVFTPTKSLTLAPKTTYSFRASNNYWLTSGSISAHTGWSLGAHSPASNNKMRIRIRADEVIAPAVIATPKTLVSNIKQGGRGTIHSSTTSFAQAFRTGVNPYGYALRGMGVYFGVTTAPPRATIHENSPTGKKVATFEPPHSGSSLYGLPDYVVLKKTTTYYVVFSGGDARIRTTPSNHVDDDSLAAYKGWNIAHILKYESGGTYLAASSNEAILLRIAGEPLASPPSEPTNVRRTAGNGRVTLTWGPPLVSNYAPLLNYRINYKKTKDPNYSSWKDYPANARRAVIASLTNGEQYDFQIRARSSEGQGPIFKTRATPNVVPPAPRSFKARGAPNNDAYLSWDAPTTGTVDYYQYLYYKSGENGTWTRVPGDASARSVTIGGLQNVAYTFGIRAVNSAGAGTFQSLSRTVGGTAINPPTNLRIKSASTTEATFTWDAPTGAAPTGYQYRYKKDTNNYPLVWTDIASGLEQTITGLTIGSTYTFQVRATTSSKISASITLALAPLPPPQNFEVLTGPSKVYFSWDAPATGTVGSYEYFYESTWNPVPGGASARNLAVEISGFQQVLYLRAISNISVGLSVNSGEISVTPVASPTNFRVKSSTPTQATLVWDSAVDTSQIRYKTGTNDYPFAWTDITSGREQTITGLTPGTAHTFQLRSKVGTAVSAPLTTTTTTTTATATPSAPQNLTAAPASTQVTLAWTAPATGATPTGYEYRYKSSGAYGNWTTATSPKIIASLTNDTAYTFEVRAKSNSGSGAKATVSATPIAPNAAPTFSSLTTASVNEGTTAVTTLTATDPDSDDTTFTYSIFGGADSAKFSINSSSGALTFKTAPDFENPTDTTTNNEYIITLRVTSGSNPREMTTEQTLTITVADTDEAPEAPAVPTLDSRTPTTLTLNWIAPTNAGPPITDYDYRYRAGNAGAWNIIANDINDALTFTFTTLTASTSYQVGIRATNAEGDSDWSTSTSFTTPAAPPSAPQSLTAAPANTQVTLAWTAPASGTPTGYEYRYKSSGDYNSWTDTTSPKIIASLTNNTPYTFEVRAKSNSGSGAKATVSATPTAPNAAPTFSSLTTASVNEGTTAVTTLTATDPDSDDTTFTYSIFGGADSAKFSINSSSGALTFKTAPDFENPTDTTTNNEYIITLRVTSGSNARVMTTEQTLTVTVADTDEAPAAPAAPTFTSLTSTTLTLNWIAPTNTGPPITDYDYRYSTDGNSWTTIANTPIDAISTPIVGLSASTLYYVAVRATNAEGTGSWSTSTTFTTPAASVSTVPSAPQSLMAQVGNQQITLAWTAPATGATPTGYEYRQKSSGAYGNWTTATSPKIIASLTNDTAYTFEVRAKSNSGSGAKATVSATPTAPNDPPTFSSLTTASVNEGTTAVTTLTATDPDSDDTTFTYSIFGGADSAKFSINSSSGALTFKTAPDFENPTDTTTNNEYIITLRVTSGSNAREMTTEQTLTVTVADTDEAPEAPAVPTLASRTSTTLTLNWTAPTNAGPPITDYDYRYRAGNAGAWNIIDDATSTTLTSTITTLTASTSYQVGIRATNDEGDSDWSTSTSFTTLAAPPSAPQSLTAAPASTQVTLAWTAPASGTPTGYQYRYKSSGAYGNWTDTTSPKIIASLTNNTPYTFEVRAKSNSGPGAKATVSATPTAPNDPPTFSSLTTASVNEGTTAVTTLTATDPDSDDTTFTYSIFGGADSAKFSINSSSGALTFKTAPDFETPTDTTTNNEYIITLRVTSGSNPREMTTEQTLTITVADTDEAPEAPAAPTFTSLTSATLTLNWIAPTNTGPPITDYDYRYSTDGNSWTTIANTPIDAISTPIVGLSASTLYYVAVRATNAEGTGSWSTSTTFTTPAASVSTVPSAPQSLMAQVGNQQITLAWEAPATGVTPTGYEYRYKSSGDYNSWTDTTSPKIIASLTNNTPYTFEVRAKSNSGSGTEAMVSATPIASTAPNSPPTFSSLATAAVTEGTTAVTTLIATDPDSDDNTFTYSILGGADNAKFSLSGATLSFKTAPNFEATQSSANTNTYTLIVTATSGSGNRAITTEQTLTINVTDDTTSNDPIDQKAIGQPIITGSPQIGQRLTTSTTTIDDPIDGLTQPQYTYQWIRIEENGNEVVIQSANSYAYTPTQGDLGRTLKVRVEFIDDSGHSEILTSNATAAVTETTSTKELSAWLTRFGRATADQILNTVEERLRAYRSTGITLHFAGQHLPTHLTEDPQHPTENGVYSDSLLSWLTYGTKDQIQSQNMTEQELLMNSSFDLSAGNQENGFASLWGRMSQSTFQGYQNSLQLDGDITTGLLGADYTRGPWTAGLILSRSKGKGNYQGDTTGKAKASLNSLTPWAAYTGADQLSIWAATGYGKGDISLIPQEGSPQKTDIKLLLAALGTRGTLLDPSTGPRIELFSDARWVQTTSKSTTELKATQTHTARLRLGLEGSWYTTLSTGSVLIPRLTLGLRKDSGDAETGFGTDIGTHITLAMPQGLTLSLEARGLLSHQAKGFQDQGWSGTLQWDSKPDSEQGFTLSLSQSKGAASSGGTHALFAHETLEQLTLTNTDTKLIQANIAYGLPPFGNQLTARSELTLGLSDTTRQYSLAWHVSSSYLSAQSFDLSLQGTRHESIDGALAPRHSLGIQLGRQW